MKLEELLDGLERWRRIDILLLVYEHGEIGWGDANRLLREKNRPTSDGTYRDACKGLVQLGLLEARPIDKLRFWRYRYRLTDFGCLVASCIAAMVRDVEILNADMNKWLKATLPSESEHDVGHFG